MMERGLDVPERPREEERAQWPRSFRSALRGEAGLYHVFFVWYVVGNFSFWLAAILLGLVSEFLPPATLFAALLLLMAAWLVYGLVVLGALWKCAWNTDWKPWGYIVRACVVLGLLLNVLAVMQLGT